MSGFDVIIVLGLLGFLGVAALLLVPVNRFLHREEMRSRQWTEEAIKKRAQEKGNGTNGNPSQKGTVG